MELIRFGGHLLGGVPTALPVPHDTGAIGRVRDQAAVGVVGVDVAHALEAGRGPRHGTIEDAAAEHASVAGAGDRDFALADAVREARELGAIIVLG